jgi:hypothetical protein
VGSHARRESLSSASLKPLSFAVVQAHTQVRSPLLDDLGPGLVQEEPSGRPVEQHGRTAPHHPGESSTTSL